MILSLLPLSLLLKDLCHERIGTGKSIQELEKRIVTEWLPTSGFEFADGPDIEVYFDPNPQNTTYEVWIPVKKKQP